ncbi:MAG: diguanylate cyclase response regulator [Epsilonproteobacteria bacterium]|nr:MAG: diguanylate cyclase response regulator [Campylobacterota bacterium]
MKTNNNFHILIVDDEKFNIELAGIYLQEEDYKVSYALNAKTAIESVYSKEIDLILLDINMPGKDGFEVCSILKSDAKTKDIPIIFLTAQTDIEYISRAFEVGGADYINKPFNGIELKIRVKTQLQNLSYLQEIKNKQSKLAQLSITDNLTKLYNSLYFDAQVKAQLTQEKNFWITYIKINNFEKINQLYGYDKANKIIKIFSKLLSDIAFKNATVARLYGTSFGILTKDYAQQDILALGNSLSKALLKHKDLSKSITYSIVALRVSEPTTLLVIYKKLHSEIYTASNEAGSNILFIK